MVEKRKVRNDDHKVTTNKKVKNEEERYPKSSKTDRSHNNKNNTNTKHNTNKVMNGDEGVSSKSSKTDDTHNNNGSSLNNNKDGEKIAESSNLKHEEESNNSSGNSGNHAAGDLIFDPRLYGRTYEFRERKAKDTEINIISTNGKKKGEKEKKEVSQENGRDAEIGGDIEHRPKGEEKQIDKENPKERRLKKKGKPVSVNGDKSDTEKSVSDDVSGGSVIPKRKRGRPRKVEVAQKQKINSDESENEKRIEDDMNEKDDATSSAEDNALDGAQDTVNRENVKLLQDIYTYVNKSSDLFWSFKEGDEVSGARRSSSSSSKEKKEKTVSQGYGETTFKSVSRLFVQLENLPEDLRINKDSTFVDIGSGFGKVVFHARLFSKVKESTGIEYVRKRHEVAEDTLQFFQTQCLLYNEDNLEYELNRTRSPRARSQSPECNTTVKWNKDEATRDLLMQGIKFLCADATKCRLKYSHIYMYDWIFNDNTYYKLAPLLERSPFKVLVSYRPLNFLKKRGLKSIRQVGELILNSTGKQSFKAHIFAKDLSAKRDTKSGKK